MAQLIVVSVPKELAIDTNYPNMNSIFIDPASTTPAPRSTRNRARLLADLTSSQRGDADPFKKPELADSRVSAKRKNCERVSEDIDDDSSDNGVQGNSKIAHSEQPLIKRRSARPESTAKPERATSLPSPKDSTTNESCPSALLSSSSSSIKSSSPSLFTPGCVRTCPVARRTPALHLSRTTIQKAKSDSRRCDAPRITPAKSVLTQPASESGDKDVMKPSIIDDNTLKSTETRQASFSILKKNDQPHASVPRVSARCAAARKSLKRIALENHLRSHDSYGAVRMATDEAVSPVAPVNSQWDLERIEGMFQNEALMARIESAHEDQKRSRESEKKLWEVGKSMPWVLDMFKTFEEYCQWLSDAPKRQAVWAQPQVLNDEDSKDHTGDTTEEEDLNDINAQADAKDIEMANVNAAAALRQFSWADLKSKMLADQNADRMAAAQSMIELSCTGRGCTTPMSDSVDISASPNTKRVESMASGQGRSKAQLFRYGERI